MSLLERTTLIVLGAGLSSRFGSDKLSAELNGRALATHLLDAVAPLQFAQMLLIARGQGWTDQFRAAGFDLLANPAPQLGQSSSLRIALSAANAEYVLVMLADMPFVSTGHIEAISDAFAKSDGVVASHGRGRSGPPAMFRRSMLERTELRGDKGARDLLNQAVLVFTDARELLDVDTTDDYVALA